MKTAHTMLQTKTWNDAEVGGDHQVECNGTHHHAAVRAHRHAAMRAQEVSLTRTSSTPFKVDFTDYSSTSVHLRITINISHIGSDYVLTQFEGELEQCTLLQRKSRM